MRITARLPALPNRGGRQQINPEFSSRVPPDDLAAFDPKKQAPTICPQESPDPISPLDEAERLLGGAGSSRLDLLLDANLTRWKDISSSHPEFDELPELKKAVVWARRGVDPPRSPGYNIAALTRWDIHPFVSPGVDPRLQSSEVPLCVDAASYELTRRYLADGELPPHDAVRTEDFLAAIDYAYPRPTDAPIAVHAFGGLRAAPLEAEFHAGQSATALYEVFLLPNGEPEVARAEATWWGPSTSQTCTAAVTFRREQ